MKKTAKLYGLFPFDAFDKKDVRIAKNINTLATVLFFCAFGYLMYLFALRLIDLSEESHIPNIISVLYSVLTCLIVIYSTIVLTSLVSKIFKITMSKVCADEYLTEFDLSNNKILKEIIKADINENDHFSALGYWLAKEEVEKLQYRSDRRNALIKKTKSKSKSKAERYPEVFKS